MIQMFKYVININNEQKLPKNRALGDAVFYAWVY